MISQANIKWISELSGVSIEDISGALSKEEEVALDLRLSGRVITQDAEKELRESAIQQGKELGFKDIAKGLELTLDAGEKDAKVIAEKLKTTIAASLEEKYKNPKPGEREVELEKNLLTEKAKYDKLFETHETTKGEIDVWQTKYQTKEKEITTKERNNSILKSFPEKMKQDRGDALLIFNSVFEFDEVDGVQVIKKGGNVVTDAVGKPETLDNIVPSFVEEKNWLKGAGMGGGDRGAGGNKKGGKSPDEAYKYISEKLGADKVSTPEGIALYKELTATE